MHRSKNLNLFSRVPQNNEAIKLTPCAVYKGNVILIKIIYGLMIIKRKLDTKSYEEINIHLRWCMRDAGGTGRCE